jgi:hypothetical protein
LGPESIVSMNLECRLPAFAKIDRFPRTGLRAPDLNLAGAAVTASLARQRSAS